MFRLPLLLTGNAFLALALVSCGKDPAVEYRLSAEQLAWQGYQVGEELRFGHARDSRVRTYRVTEIRNSMETQFMGNVAPGLPFPSKESPLYQQVAVLAQRTDTVDGPNYVLELGLNYDPVSNLPELRAKAEWETFYYARLPLNEVSQGVQIDTLLYPGTKLFPTVTLGSITYQAVIHVVNRFPQGPPAPGNRPTRALYYARGKGVVAFEEAGNDLWYRLP